MFTTPRQPISNLLFIASFPMLKSDSFVTISYSVVMYGSWELSINCDNNKIKSSLMINLK